jgi:hypothetical protein
METLKKEIEQAELGEINLAWCVLKRKDGMGIKKKLEILEYLFDLPEGVLIEESIKDADGRILDKANREIIHSYLIENS